MRDPLVEALTAALSEGLQEDAALRRAYADFRETCASAIDPKSADRDLVRLLARHQAWGDEATPVGKRFAAVLARLPELAGPPVRARPQAGATLSPELLTGGLERLLEEHLRLSLAEVRVLDPWAGEGALLGAVAERAGGSTRLWANEADPLAYTRAFRRRGASFRGLCFADSFRLPDRSPTPGFDFSDDENTERIGTQQSLGFEVVVSDLRRPARPDARAVRRTKETYGEGRAFAASVRWMSDRLAPKGIVAFVSDGAFIDEPCFAGMRACLEREFGHIAHVVFEDYGLTFLVRGPKPGRIVYGISGSAGPLTSHPLSSGEGVGGFAEVEWQALVPSSNHVWRTEILRPEWSEFMPLAEVRGAIFSGTGEGVPDGRDVAIPKAKGARRVFRRPFTAAYRTLDRAARREPWPDVGPTIVVLREPFGVVATNAPVDRRFGGAKGVARTISGAVSAGALRRFRVAYGAGVVERDVFDYALALLHHPDYRTRYGEDLRRGVPRIPLLGVDRLAPLADVPDAPEAGPGTAFGTGWLAPDDFEPGTLPDYDDPFASPYARTDVDPGFLLLCGLGAALYRVQVDFERLLSFPLERVESDSAEAPTGAMRLSRDRTKVVVSPSLTLAGIPQEASRVRIGRRSALEWIVEVQRPRRDFDPSRPDDPERPARLVGQAVAASLEIARLTEIVGLVNLDRLL